MITVAAFVAVAAVLMIFAEVASGVVDRMTARLKGRIATTTTTRLQKAAEPIIMPRVEIHYGEREWRQWLAETGMSEESTPFEAWLFAVTEYEPGSYQSSDEAYMHYECWAESRHRRAMAERN